MGDGVRMLDLRCATLCEPDGTVIGKSVLIPPDAYGRRIRAVHICDDRGVAVVRIRLDASAVHDKVGGGITVSRWTARTGQGCVCIRGTRGGLLMGEGFVSLSRRTIRGMKVSLTADGCPDVRI